MKRNRIFDFLAYLITVNNISIHKKDCIIVLLAAYCVYHVTLIALGIKLFSFKNCF